MRKVQYDGDEREREKIVQQDLIQLALVAHTTGDPHCKNDDDNERNNEAYPSALPIVYGTDQAFVQSDFPITSY